jgi:hypothetical protein
MAAKNGGWTTWNKTSLLWQKVQRSKFPSLIFGGKVWLLTCASGLSHGETRSGKSVLKTYVNA